MKDGTRAREVRARQQTFSRRDPLRGAGAAAAVGAGAIISSPAALAAEPGTESDLSPPTDAIPTLERVYARYLRPIYLYLYARVGSREDAEDLASETFLKASCQLDLARSEASIAAWLFTVAKTVLADHWRRYYRYGALLPLDELPMDPTADTLIAPAQRSELAHQVANLLASLPRRHRGVLQLRFLDGCSVLETAQELGVTPGNAKVLQHRALAQAVRVGRSPAFENSGHGLFYDEKDKFNTTPMQFAG